MLIPTGGPLDHPRLFSKFGIAAWILGHAIERVQKGGGDVEDLAGCPRFELMALQIEETGAAERIGA